MYSVGNYGYSRASTITDNKGYYLGFSYSWLNPNNNSHHANGLQLRCLQE